MQQQQFDENVERKDAERKFCPSWYVAYHSYGVSMIVQFIDVFADVSHLSNLIIFAKTLISPK